MIINARTADGVKTKIYNADGTRIALPIKEYNTETQEAVVFELDENGKVKCTPWVKDEKSGKMTRELITKTVKLQGSYAEIDGKRV